LLPYFKTCNSMKFTPGFRVVHVLQFESTGISRLMVDLYFFGRC
jgi:hypothetical protein